MINHVSKNIIKRLSAACALAFIAIILCVPMKIAFAAGCGDVKDPTCEKR